MLKIKELYAYVSVDTDNGEEGIVAVLNPEFGWHPLVGGDRARVEAFRERVEEVARQTGKDVKLYRFPGPREELAHIDAGTTPLRRSVRKSNDGV